MPSTGAMRLELAAAKPRAKHIIEYLTRWGVESPSTWTPEKKYGEWARDNVEQRINAWTTLATIAGFLAAFVLSEVTGIEHSDWTGSSVDFTVYAVLMSLSLASLVSSVLLLTGVIWNVQRQLGHDFAIRSLDGIDGFEPGVGAHMLLKAFTERHRFCGCPFNIVNASGYLFVFGTSTYLTSVALKLQASVPSDATALRVVLVVLILLPVAASVLLVVKMGIKLS